MRRLFCHIVGLYLVLGPLLYYVLFMVYSSQNMHIITKNNLEVEDGGSPEVEMDILMKRRVTRIVVDNYDLKLALRWISEMKDNGTWSDVDYTSGCPARRAEWPAPDHLRRLLTIASAWVTHKNPSMLDAASHALEHWFSNDFTSNGCINGNAGRKCPCSTPGYWNPNWWYQMILLPHLVGSTCLLLFPALSADQFAICTTQISRSWDRIDGEPGMMGRMTGANLLDVANAGGTLAILTRNDSLFGQSANRIWTECALSTQPPSVDGLKIDGSFMQHSGQLHTGSYGKGFMQQMLYLLTDSKGTSYQPPMTSKVAFHTLFSAAEWFIYRNGTELAWSYPVIGRWVSHKWVDWAHLRGIEAMLSKVLEATEGWDDAVNFKDIVVRLRDQKNPWRLTGSRYSYISDCLVHRGPGYIITLKMYSSRTVNSECLNSQNPKGYHLSDGAIYSLVSGMEYIDAPGAWDWDLIPGTTSIYHGTILACHLVQNKGLHQRVGAVASTAGAVAVMTHVNPRGEAYNFTKTYFFFPGAYAVQYPQLWWNASSNNPMRTTLDQRHAIGPVFVDGELLVEGAVHERKASNLWHDRIGYTFEHAADVGVGIVKRVAKWAELGISVGNETQTHFVAYVNHKIGENGVGYIAQLNVNHTEFQKSPQGGVSLLKPSVEVTAASFREKNSPKLIVGLAFLSSFNYSTGLKELPWVSADSPVLLLFHREVDKWQMALSDPTQSLKTVTVLASLEGNLVYKSAKFPQSPYAGSTIIVQLQE